MRVVVVALLAGLLLVGPPAQAAPPAAVKVSVSASTTKATTGSALRFSGKVGGRSAGAVVAVERRTQRGWVVVRTGKVTAGKKYVVRTTVRQGATRYRVKVRRTARIKASVSRVVTVRGVRASAPAPAPSPSPSPSPSPVSPEVALILQETNAFRAQHQLKPLTLSAPISEVAQRWSQTMASTGTFAHNPSYASQIPKGWTRAAENIAAGYAVDAVVDGWINSPGHRANLLGDFTHIGIGYVSAPGTPYTRYFTQNFAKY
ncbi:hypothetical protein GCM10007231_15390 [Nocardioides daphniae]|uniref:CAP domain-containing protein n=2 Tax=Nocardioides daphniae TaxID=402297 RepID=A0A4P7UFF9_9ACTN|nr:CAP domain-containing protein [Nocardioides daphniae]QCC78644.1 CAP domain-containing protein [Nocardioides daphniae]GGD17327.1 hypothetical protein GCM10007231_15390 [Nocardioides daphniae]